MKILAAEPPIFTNRSSLVDIYGRGRSPVLNSIPADEKISLIADVGDADSYRLSGSGTIVPNCKSFPYRPATETVIQFANLKTIANCLARLADSGSESRYSIKTFPGFFPSSSINLSWCAASARQENCALSCAASNSAFPARSFASPAFVSAAPSLTLDLTLSSVWMRLFRMPNKTSPIIPIPMTASGQIDSFRNVSYGGSHQAIMSSATTERTTNTPHQIPHFSQDDDAASNSSSEAFFVPFGKYHAGNNRFRTFIVALLGGTLFWGAVFALWHHLGWIG
jgi:hypothetical protein